MGVSDQLTTTTTYNPVPSAPAGIARDGDFDSGSDKRDARGNRVQVLTITGFTAGEEFTIKVRLVDGGYIAGGTTYTQGTDMTAAAMQSDLRTRTGDSALTVTGTSDTGPFTITHTPGTFPKGYPRYTLVSTQGSGVFTPLPDPEGDATIGLLGESHRVSETNTILKPTIGTITVTASTKRIDTLDYASATAGGTFALRAGSKLIGSFAYNAEASAIEAAIDAALGAGVVDVSRRGTNEVQTLTLSSWDASDTIKLTYGTHESSAVTQASDATAAFQSAIDEVAALVHSNYTAGDIVVTRTSATVYVFTFSGASVRGKDVGAITATSGTGSATGAVVETTPGVNDGFTFTYTANAAGTPATAISLESQALTDGASTTKTATYSTTTAGVLGSASIAYTEQGGGSDVLACAVNDTTGTTYGFVKDAATPVVTGSLPPGAYHAVLRTVESGRVSKADTKAFTVT